MQFLFSASQYPASNAKLAEGAALRAIHSVAAGRKVDCGWYDSSFDLAQGLDVCEEDCHTLYQLWELSQN